MSHEFFTLQLPNGVHLVHMKAQMASARCGILINSGARDENGPRGTAHFLEHMFFKGTQKRKAFHILSVIDNSGGELNAYTTKEETFIYASCLKGDMRKAIGIIADVVQNSVFPEKEIEKERGVILDEINSYKDDPTEDILDCFEEHWFAGHELGSNILGTEDDVKKIGRKTIMDFIDQCYVNEQIVFCSIGQFSPEKMVQMASPFLNSFRFNAQKRARIPFVFKGNTFNRIEKRPVYGAHCLMGFPGISRNDEDRIVCGVLNNLLGGPSMNSLLSMTLREKHGICYQIESQLLSYTDTGIWTIYLNTDPGKMDKAVQLTLNEIKKLRTKMLSSLKVHQAKKQVKGQLALSHENPGNMIHIIGKSYLQRGSIETLKEIIYEIDKITPEKILEAANKYLNADKMSSLIFSPA